MDLKALRALRENTLFAPGVGEFVDALLDYLHAREGGPFEPTAPDPHTGPAMTASLTAGALDASSATVSETA